MRIICQIDLSGQRRNVQYNVQRHGAPQYAMRNAWCRSAGGANFIV